MSDQEECEVSLLQSKSIPKNCVKKVIDLEKSLWTPLGNNEWLFVSPEEESMTVLCGEQDSRDLHLKGVGILVFHTSCKGYGSQVYIQSSRIIQTNITRKDIVPSITRNIGCCEDIDMKVNMSNIALNLPLKDTVTRLDDLRVAGKRLDEVQQMITEQQQEMDREKRIQHYSIATYLVLIIMVMIMVFCCCSHCSCCRCIYKILQDWFSGGGSCCKSICVRTKVVNEDAETRLSREDIAIYERHPQEGNERVYVKNRR